MKKLVVITGATSGIGLAIANKLSEQGHPLLLLGRRIEKLNEIKLPNAMKRQVDVRDVEALRSAIAEAEKEYGDVDLLVNNAGLMQLGDADKQPIEEWNNMIDINMKGVFNGCHIVLDKMKKNKTGTIINISSVVGKKALGTMAVYCGTKFGVSAFSEALRQEVALDNVRVLVVCPGAVATELQGHTSDKKYKEYLEQYAKEGEQALKAEDIANLISYSYNLPQNVCIRDMIITPTKQVL